MSDTGCTQAPDGESLVFRLADEPDADTIAWIIQEAYADQAQLLGINPEIQTAYPGLENPEDTRARMAEGKRILLALLNGEPVGTIRYHLHDPQTGYIARLGVLPPYRGRGFARALLFEAENRLRQEGVAKLTLAFYAPLTRLRQWYTRLGYRPFLIDPNPKLGIEIVRMEKQA